MDLMKNKFKVALIGGTGKSGKYLTRQLLHHGFPVKMLVRDPEKLTTNNPLIEVVNGNARDYSTILSLVEGCHAVISTLGGHTKGEPPIFSQASTHVVHAMKACKIKRYILTTGLNVDAPSDKKGFKTALATQWMKENYPLTTADKQKERDILSESGIDWTLVRLPLIELTDEKGDIKVSLEDCPGDKISATDLADFLIGQLEDRTYVRSAPFIANCC
jgi:putative NADH-flavin reductase